jgi:hypothetical protein
MQTQQTGRTVTSRLGDEQGVALVIALLSMLLLTALGMALTMTTSTEGKIATNYRDGVETLYAADAAVERVMQDVLTVPDWNNILNGVATSAFIDGIPGERTLPNGQKIDLTHATNMLRCGKTTACLDADMNASTEERPWALNNPRWQLYAYGPLHEMMPVETINSGVYVIVWIADDPSESDNNPVRDGDACLGTKVEPIQVCGPNGENLGKGVLSMLAQAYGPGGVMREIEVTIARTDTTEIERGYTGQRGQDEQNRRARKAAVQTPGKALTSRSLGTSSDAGFQKP